MSKATKLWIPDNSGGGVWEDHTKPQYYLSVLWGEQPDEDATPTTYSFNSEREREAFMKGVNEAEGRWGVIGYCTMNPRPISRNNLKIIRR